MDPATAIQQLTSAFTETRKRVQLLENTLAVERRISQDALAEAKASAVISSAQREEELNFLRGQVSRLEELAKTREQVQTPLKAGNNSSDWKERLSTALEGFKQTEAAKTHCAELERTVHALQEDNGRLTQKADALTEKAYEAIALKLQAEQLSVELEKTVHTLRKDNQRLAVKASESLAEKLEAERSEEESSDKYDELETRYKDLKRAYSELHTKQQELVANAAAHHDFALSAARGKAEADTQKAEVEQSLHDLQGRYDDLKTKYKKKRKIPAEKNGEEMDAQIAELTKDLAKATKLKDKALETQGKLDGMYREQKAMYRSQLAMSTELQTQYDKLSATNKNVTKEYLALKEERGATSDSQAKHSRIKVLYQELEATCNELKVKNGKLVQDCRDLWSKNNTLEKRYMDALEAAELADGDTAGLRNTTNALRDTIRSLEDQLVRVKQVKQALRSRIQHGRVQTSVARVLYDDFMDAFPSSVPGRPDFANLKAVGKADMNIYSYLGADPFCKGHVLHLPRRTVWTSGTRLHALAFGPTHAYRPSAETWRESSEISALGGTSRELFVEKDDALFYVGTYRCHDLRYLCPGGTRAPDAVSAFEIINAAQLGDLPVAESVCAIKKFFSDGVIPADCLGLECVGFNSTLYNALCARVTEFQRGSKRGADEMAPEEYGRRANRLEDDLPTWTIKKEDC